MAEKGRPRTFLSKSLDRFLISRHHREKKREGREVSVDDARFTFDPKLEQRYEREVTSSRDSPHVVFDRQWCAALLRRVLAQLEAAYADDGKLRLFAVLQPVLMSGGSLRGHDVAAIAAGLSMTGPALRTALSRMLRAYRKLLVAEVRDTVEHSADVDAEIAHLLGVMERK